MSLDILKIKIKSGDGGKGSISYEKLPPFTSNGGNGGNGGNIILEPDFSYENFLHLKQERLFQAENGLNGSINNRTGKNGKDLIIKLPYNSIIEYENDEISKINDINNEKNNKKLEKKTIILDKPFRILEGGKGGLGNGSLKKNLTKPPQKGKSLEIIIKINIIADIGLVGKPNCGKSSFIQQFTNSKSLIADYPFSTLVPKIGIWTFMDKKMSILDIPGLISGASKGKGLGNDFLRYVNECKFLIIMLDASSNYYEDFLDLKKELDIFGIKKPFIILVNKIDLISNITKNEIFNKFFNHKVILISLKQKINLNTITKYVFNC